MDGTLLNKKYKLEERVTALEEGGGGGLPDYSTTEQKTGQKWIDGKDIYFKAIEIDNPVSTGTPTSVSHGANVDTIVKFEGYSMNSGVFMPITYYAATNYYAMVYASASSIIYDVNWNNAQFEKIVVIIYYTKAELTTKKRSTSKKTEK